MPNAGFVQQESLPAALLVAATDSPDGGRITFAPGGHGANGFPTGDGQYDAGMLDLEPRQVPSTSNGLNDREIPGSDGQGARFASTHGRISGVATGLNLPEYHWTEFLALLVSRYTRRDRKA